MCVVFLWTLVFIGPSRFLVVLVSRNAMDPSFSSSTVKLICTLIDNCALNPQTECH